RERPPIGRTTTEEALVGRESLLHLIEDLLGDDGRTLQPLPFRRWTVLHKHLDVQVLFAGGSPLRGLILLVVLVVSDLRLLAVRWFAHKSGVRQHLANGGNRPLLPALGEGGSTISPCCQCPQRLPSRRSLE